MSTLLYNAALILTNIPQSTQYRINQRDSVQ